MGKLKHRAKKKRLNKASKKASAPLWASIRKFGMKRIITGNRRRIRVQGRNHWRRDSKVQA